MPAHHYFISYTYDPPTGGDGYANAQIRLDHPICSIEDITTIQDTIESQTGNRNPVVLFWRRFERPE